MSRPPGPLPDEVVQLVVAQTLKGGLGPADGEPITGSSPALLAILVVLVAMLIFWASGRRAATGGVCVVLVAVLVQLLAAGPAGAATGTSDPSVRNAALCQPTGYKDLSTSTDGSVWTSLRESTGCGSPMLNRAGWAGR